MKRIPSISKLAKIFLFSNAKILLYCWFLRFTLSFLIKGSCIPNATTCNVCRKPEWNDISLLQIRRVDGVWIIQWNKTLLRLNFTVWCKPPDVVHAYGLGTEVWPSRGCCCESVSDFQQLGESNPSLCALCLCPITYLRVMGFIISTPINSLVF